MSNGYLTLAQAREALGVSAFVFNQRFRPELTEIRRGPRTILFDRVEVETVKGESDGMWNKKKVSDALDHAWDLKWRDSRGPKKKKSLMQQVDSEIGDVPLSKLDYSRIEQWVMELRESDKAVATIKSRLSCLTFALKIACKKGWIKSVPMVPDMETPNRKIRYLLDDPDEERALLEATGVLHYQIADVMKPAIVFLLDTGARLSELLKVRWGNVSDAGVMFEERKAGDCLRVPLTPEARTALETLLESKYWMARVRGANLDKKRMTSAQNWFTHQFAKVRDKAKLHDVSAHTLRHTCASRLVQAGVSLYEVRQLLGHSSITVTERYSHLAPSSLDRAVTVLKNRRLSNKVRKMRPQSQ